MKNAIFGTGSVGLAQGAVLDDAGLAFQPNTDDMHEAPSRVLMEALWAIGEKVQAYDSEAMPEARLLWASMEGALEGGDVLAIVTEWEVFRAPNFDLIKSRLAQPVIFDGRNLYEPASIRAMGLRYFIIGRGA